VLYAPCRHGHRHASGFAAIAVRSYWRVSKYAGTFFVSEPVTVIVAHHLGKVEAVRRLKDGFARTKGQLGHMIAIEQETWEGDTLRFHMRALGQTAAGTIEVLDDALRIEVSLPWLLAKAAKRLLPILRTEATLLLEKK
jgi:hypothetical protein